MLIYWEKEVLAKKLPDYWEFIFAFNHKFTLIGLPQFLIPTPQQSGRPLFFQPLPKPEGEKMITQQTIPFVAKIAYSYIMYQKSKIKVKNQNS